MDNQQAPNVNCDFCGKHKNMVPLLIVSSVTKSSICTFCAIQVTQQSMQHQMAVTIEFKKVVDAFPDLFEQDDTGAIKVVPGDKRLDAAIKAVESNSEEEDNNKEDREEGDDEPLCDAGPEETLGETTSKA